MDSSDRLPRLVDRAPLPQDPATSLHPRYSADVLGHLKRLTSAWLTSPSSGARHRPNVASLSACGAEKGFASCTLLLEYVPGMSRRYFEPPLPKRSPVTKSWVIFLCFFETTRVISCLTMHGLFQLEPRSIRPTPPVMPLVVLLNIPGHQPELGCFESI
jgi:hypothetical protein